MQQVSICQYTWYTYVHQHVAEWTWDRRQSYCVSNVAQIGEMSSTKWSNGYSKSNTVLKSRLRSACSTPRRPENRNQPAGRLQRVFAGCQSSREESSCSSPRGHRKWCIEWPKNSDYGWNKTFCAVLLRPFLSFFDINSMQAAEALWLSMEENSDSRVHFRLANGMVVITNLLDEVRWSEVWSFFKDFVDFSGIYYGTILTSHPPDTGTTKCSHLCSGSYTHGETWRKWWNMSIGYEYLKKKGIM